ncbi:MAG: nucleotidyltransferase family protein [Bacteroidota bacterium]
MIPIVILAAGSSSRMGKPKQNLLYKGQTLLEKIIRSSEAASDNVIIVLGANYDVIKATIKDTHSEILYNNDWELGMSSSIKLAVSHIKQKYTDEEGVIFAVCDQPYVTSALLTQIIETADKVKQGVIACSYNGTVGVPALFKKAYYSNLLKLSGQEGAKKIIEQHPQDVFSIPFRLGSADIDTEEDFNNLLINSD